MDCMQLQDRREKNFLLDNEVPTMDDSNVLPTGNYGLDFKASRQVK